jgi:hypothetical protein
VKEPQDLLEEFFLQNIWGEERNKLLSSYQERLEKFDSAIEESRNFTKEGIGELRNLEGEIRSLEAQKEEVGFFKVLRSDANAWDQGAAHYRRSQIKNTLHGAQTVKADIENNIQTSMEITEELEKVKEIMGDILFFMNMESYCPYLSAETVTLLKQRYAVTLNYPVSRDCRDGFIKGLANELRVMQNIELNDILLRRSGRSFVLFLFRAILPMIRNWQESEGEKIDDFSSPPSFIADEEKYDALQRHTERLMEYATPTGSHIFGPNGVLTPGMAKLLDNLPDVRKVDEAFDRLAEYYGNIPDGGFQLHEDATPRYLFAGTPGTLEDIATIYASMWVYAVRMPHDEVRFSRAFDLYQRVAGETFPEGNDLKSLPCVDCLLAKIYSLRKVNGDVDALRNAISDWENHFIGRKDKDAWAAVTTLAFGLRWMDLIWDERETLRKMAVGGVPMNLELNDRLRLLNGLNIDKYIGHAGTRSTAGGDVGFDESVLVFDTGSLRQDSREFGAFFDLLIAQGKPLSHALTTEDWQPDAELTIAKDTQWNNDEVLKEIAKEIVGEYEDSVHCERRSLAMLTQTSIGTEPVDGLLVTREEFLHLGLFVYIVKDGRMIEPHIYTLVLPVIGDAETMKTAQTLAVTLKAIASGENVNPRIATFIRNVRKLVSNALSGAGAKSELGMHY